MDIPRDGSALTPRGLAVQGYARQRIDASKRSETVDRSTDLTASRRRAIDSGKQSRRNTAVQSVPAQLVTEAQPVTETRPLTGAPPLAEAPAVTQVATVTEAPAVTQAQSVSSATRRPFIKWAGGKRQLLPELLRHVPPRFRQYYEPFVGGGALFFELAPEQAVLADVNARLIRTYRGVRNHVADVIRLLSSYPHDEKFFYELRDQDIDSASDAEVAAWFIYLNKIGFNGLYRVNRRNRFNVPFGRHRNPTICDEATLRACSAALSRARLEVADFEQVVAQAHEGDLVYFDPPYVPLSVTSSFTRYTSTGFDHQGQVRLRDVALKLKRRGVHVLLSNSSAAQVRDLYRDAFETVEVSATRLVNSKVTGRGAITELVIR